MDKIKKRKLYKARQRAEWRKRNPEKVKEQNKYYRELRKLNSK